MTRFALDHGVSEWTAWVLDPMVCVALLAVLLADARLVELGAAPSGWATALRWFAGVTTWAMNVWSSVWPDGEFGVPRDVDPAGVVLHSVAPVLLVLLAEAATGYRRVIAARIRHLEGPEAFDNVQGFRPGAVHHGGHPSLGVVVDDAPAFQMKHLGAAAAAGDHLRGAPEMVLPDAIHLNCADAVSSWDEPWRAPWGDYWPGPLADHTQPQEIAAPYGTRAVTPVVAEWQSTMPSDDHRHDHLDDQQTTSGVVAEVVAPVVMSRPSDDRSHDHLDDHADDQAGTSCDPGKMVAPVVAEPVQDGRLDDHAGDEGDTAAWTLDDQAPEGYGVVPTPAQVKVNAQVTGMTVVADLRQAGEWIEPRASVGRPEPSDAELRKAARKLQMDALRTSRNPVTIQTLQTELGLSRRRAAALRREVVGGAR
ncbi:hypothetical protein [Yinghuangia sp. YIM S10712]|uniref:hypothetical protein n=1 Tax=Yinghuangia sp. YIM S10712 TaxID=3436930 RepID=UPI003F5335B7